jgi:outer membrane lipopolysaccharide assembly protein LptE/RlpB
MPNIKNLKFICFSGLSLLLAACGYQLSPSPYSLLQPLTVSVPVAANQSPYADLGPRLTRAVIVLLDSSANITVRETAPATLRLNITNVAVSGGAWDPNRNKYDLPTASASRMVNLTVEATLEKPGETGTPSSRRVRVSSHRTYYINNEQSRTTLSEDEHGNWVLEDLAQKITQSIFSEF